MVLLIIILLALLVFAPLTYVIMNAAGVDTSDLDAAMESFRFWTKGI
ncbi:hypothetical protein EM6_0921 [Asticcacaulis excentricus]|uniref:Uncharacterized protein n=1 Tax=Asticcacaulis excentricus TaxID=78587 RepID=A0A3G9G3K9_9CAUL|nr:hypothetical protein EM6_0921 [Asticcacaulis excentricus]